MIGCQPGWMKHCQNTHPEVSRTRRHIDGDVSIVLLCTICTRWMLNSSWIVSFSISHNINSVKYIRTLAPIANRWILYRFLCCISKTVVYWYLEGFDTVVEDELNTPLYTIRITSQYQFFSMSYCFTAPQSYRNCDRAGITIEFNNYHSIFFCTLTHILHFLN